MELNKQNTKKIMQLIAFSFLFYFTIKRLDLVFASLGFIASQFKALIIGGVLAFIINVPMKNIEHLLKDKCHMQKASRLLAWFLSVISVVFIVFLLLFIVIPELANTTGILIEQMQQLYNKVPMYIDKLSAIWPHLDQLLAGIEFDWQAMSQDALKTLQSTLTSLINSGTSFFIGVISGITTSVLSFIFSIYLLFSKEKVALALKQLMYALFPARFCDKTIYIANLSNKTFSNFLSGQCLEAVILGTMFVISMSVLNLPYALLIGMVIAVTALIPIFGAFIGCGIGIFLIVMISPIKAVWFVVLFLVLQQIEGNLIYPYVVGSSIGLPSILVFISVIIGGNLMGVLGMLLFIPLASVLYTLTKEFVTNRLNKKNISFAPLSEKQQGIDCNQEKQE